MGADLPSPSYNPEKFPRSASSWPWLELLGPSLLVGFVLLQVKGPKIKLLYTKWGIQYFSHNQEIHRQKLGLGTNEVRTSNAVSLSPSLSPSPPPFSHLSLFLCQLPRLSSVGRLLQYGWKDHQQLGFRWQWICCCHYCEPQLWGWWDWEWWRFALPKEKWERWRGGWILTSKHTSPLLSYSLLN